MAVLSGKRRGEKKGGEKRKGGRGKHSGVENRKGGRVEGSRAGTSIISADTNTEGMVKNENKCKVVAMLLSSA